MKNRWWDRWDTLYPVPVGHLLIVDLPQAAGDGGLREASGGERAKRDGWDTWDRRDTWDSWDGMTDAERQGCRRSVDHAKNSAVEGEREKRDDQGHASQCNYDFNHPGSIGRKFLTLGESL